MIFSLLDPSRPEDKTYDEQMGLMTKPQTISYYTEIQIWHYALPDRGLYQIL